MALGGFSPLPLPLGGTDVNGITAEQHARLAADLAACVRSCPLALVFADTDGGLLYVYHSQYGSGLSSSIVPARTAVGAGDLRIIWSPSYKDEYDNAWPINIQQAVVTPYTASALFGTAELVTAQEVRVRIRNSAGTLTNSAFFLVVY